jgi:acetolactate decarboxylase
MLDTSAHGRAAWRLPVLLLLLLPAGCSSPPQGTLYQVSTIDALLAGVYDGEVRFADVMRHGDFGIGTFDALGGEMVAVDGRCHDVRFDGRVLPVDPARRTPFAAVTFFTPGARTPALAATNLAHLTAQLDAAIAATNRPCAIRIDGSFRYVRTRSVPPQKPPYPPLAEVAKSQAVFEFRDVAGTLVGFRCPAWMKGVNVPGYHLHFLTADRTGGGHVLELAGEGLVAQLDACHTVTAVLPGSAAFGAVNLSQDRSRELERVEK